MHVDLLILAVAVVLGIVATVLVMAVRLSLRLIDRGTRNAVERLSRAPRSLFGPRDEPPVLCRRLLQKHASIAPGIQGGLSFVCSGCPGRLDFIAGRTEIRFEPGARAKESLEISSPSFVAQLAEDDPEAFRVRGATELAGRILSNPAIAMALRKLGSGFEWKWGPAGFYLEIRRLPADEEELWRWLKLAFALLQSIPGFEGGLPADFRPPSRAVLAESSCQVCGGSLGEGMIVYCRRCRTPHHDECWAYAGVCSTFACQESRSSPADQAGA